jgi:hypothetical protein
MAKAASSKCRLMNGCKGKNMNLLKNFVGMALALMLAACGGGGGNPGSTTSGSSTTGTGTTTTTAANPTAASFVFSLDKTSINNGGTDKAALTITVLDASRNVISGVPVAVSVDSGLYTALASETGATGEANGTIAIGGDKANRNITATITVGSLTGTAVVAVTGSKLSLAALPATPAPGANVQVTAKATDANGVPISGASIQFGGTLGFAQTVITNISGDAVATIAAPALAGTYNVTAAGLGTTGTKDVQVVVAGGGGGIPDAVGVISSASLQINPTSVFANVAGATTNRATLQATFQDAANQAIQNVRVRFEIVPPGLGSGELISTGSSTVYSDVSGGATSAYIPGTRTSPTNGVIIRACYGLTDASIAGGACPASVTRTMTVGGQALSVTLGFNNELSKANNNLTYVQRFVALVTDSNGNPVANAVLSGSVDITHYGKGYRYNDPYIVSNAELITPPNTSTTGINSTDDPTSVPGTRVWCKNEDINRNGFLDFGEDINGNGKLDSRKADVVLSFVGTNVTAADGTLQLQVQYPQNVATWLSFTIKVSTGVAGSEGSDEKSFFTGYVEGDQTNGSFLTPPFGVKDCSAPD